MRNEVQRTDVMHAFTHVHTHLSHVALRTMKSIYLYAWLISLLKGGSQDKAFKVQGEFTHLFFYALSL